MIKTRGITHLALAVRDPAHSARFYRLVFGMKAVYRDDDFIQLQTPGSFDVLVLERSVKQAGRPGGVAHFGFRVTDPGEMAKAARAVRRAGGRVLSEGEFVPGEPYLFAEDLDGYEVEIWYERPTPVDPPPPRGRRRLKKAK